MKVYLYYQLYEICEDLIYHDEEDKNLYAFTTNKKLAKQFEKMRCMKAFFKKVIPTDEFRDFGAWMNKNRDLQLIEIPVQTRGNEKAIIVGTYKEDSLMSTLLDINSNFLDDISLQFMTMVDNHVLTKQAMNDIMALSEYTGDIFNSDYDVLHIFYQTFLRSFVDRKTWEEIEHKRIYESEDTWKWY